MSFTGVSYCGTLPAPARAHQGDRVLRAGRRRRRTSRRARARSACRCSRRARASSRRSRRTPRAPPRSRSSRPTASRAASSTTASRRPASRLCPGAVAGRSPRPRPGARAPRPRTAEAVLDVSGEVLATEPRLEVRVLVTNRGDRPAAPVEVSGELLGSSAPARLAAELAPGGSGAVVLDVRRRSGAAGVHALDAAARARARRARRDAGGNPPLASERAWLLVALGASPRARRARCAAAPSRIAVRGALEVDARERRRRAAPRRAAGADAPAACASRAQPLEVDVPAIGAARVRRSPWCARVPRAGRATASCSSPSRATAVPVRTAVAVAPVEVAPDESLAAAAARRLLVASRW